MEMRCSICGNGYDVRDYNGGLSSAAVQQARSPGIRNKVRLCPVCYERRLIEVQTNYWKEHIAEEKLRKMPDILSYRGRSIDLLRTL